MLCNNKMQTNKCIKEEDFGSMKYEIKGEPFPVVECTVADGETLKCQAGAMAWMTGNMEMATKSGGLGKMLGRLLGKSVVSY